MSFDRMLRNSWRQEQEMLSYGFEDDYYDRCDRYEEELEFQRRAPSWKQVVRMVNIELRELANK